MAKHGKTSVDAKALTTTKHMRRRKKISKGRKSEARGPSTSSFGQSSHNKTFIHPIGNTTFEPCNVHSNIMPCIKRIFPEAVKTFKTAPQHLKDVWFNEFKKRHEWDPNDEGTVRLIFEKKATRLLADALCEVRTNLASGDAVPGWISDPVFARVCMCLSACLC
nr:putative transposase En/Spm [Ipomoea batatas]